MWGKLTFVLCLALGFPSASYAGSAVVTDGRFTNIYVFKPNFSGETWDMHLRSARPSDGTQFSRAAIDQAVDSLMAPDWPSYFDVLHQYNDINPPQFFGSGFATQNCVDAALHDASGAGLLSSDTMRSLANCHEDGMDPSPQVILILAPEIHVQQATLILAAGVSDICSPGSAISAYHFGGINGPNFAVIPTNPGCSQNFAKLVQLIAHEVVETVSDPNGAGMGNIGQNELGDNCQKTNITTNWNNQQLQTYWSNADQACEPTWGNSQTGMASETWSLHASLPAGGAALDSNSAPLMLTLPKNLPAFHGPIQSATLVIQTGSDNLNNGNSATASLCFRSGTPTCAAPMFVNQNLQSGSATNVELKNWTTRGTNLVFLKNTDTAAVSGVKIGPPTQGGDTWKIANAALIVHYLRGNSINPPPLRQVLFDASGLPLQRFTGSAHDLKLTIHSLPALSPSRLGAQPPATIDPRDNFIITELSVGIYTGNDNLNGGKPDGGQIDHNNCTITLTLKSSGGPLATRTIVLPNANHSLEWKGWSFHWVAVPSAQLQKVRVKDILSINVHTDFNGNDNWNLERIKLLAFVQNPLVTEPQQKFPAPSH